MIDVAAMESNWRQGRCSSVELKGHRDYIRCAQLQGSHLATCSGSYMQHDCSIKCDAASSECGGGAARALLPLCDAGWPSSMQHKQQLAARHCDGIPGLALHYTALHCTALHCTAGCGT